MSTRVPKQPQRYVRHIKNVSSKGTYDTNNDLRTYEETMFDIDLEK